MYKKRPTKESTPVPYPIRSRASDRNNTTITDTAEDSMATHEDSMAQLEKANEANDTVPIALIRELISQVETNLSNKFDKAVDEIKGDVSQIKLHLEQYNENFREVQERISDVEDKVAIIDTFTEELEIFKQEWKVSLSEINLDACRMRKKNVIIQGVKGECKDPEVALKNFQKVCLENLKMTKEWVDNVDLNEVYHFTPKGGEGPWPLFISFAKSRQREDLFRAAPNLKDSGITLRNDLAPCLLKIRNSLIEVGDQLKKDPYNCNTRLRDSPYDVWMIVKRPNTSKWFRWKGWDNFVSTNPPAY